MDIASRRLSKELVEVSKSKDNDILLQTTGDSLFNWIGYIKGPPDSAFEKGWFKLEYTIGANYPANPPKVKFLTRVFHPNIHFEKGEICLEVLKQGTWNPQWTLESVTRAIVNLLLNPNADSPLNCDAGNAIREGDMLAYNTMARMYTIEFASE
jgi:peroxin-4